MQMPITDPVLKTLRMPGATLTTRLKVYDSPGPDGQRGGTPHIHLMCTEMYFVTGGSGAVELIDTSGFSVVELVPQSALVFSPGTIHRLINPNGNLELFIIMQNSGLPERGDNVVSFPDELMQDDDAFRGAMRVSSPDEAYTRRNRGVEGFLQIKAAFAESESAGQQVLQRFYEQANARTQSLRDEWRSIVTGGALAEAQTSLQHLDALENGSTQHLTQARHFAIHADEHKTLGFCGRLNRYFDPATLALEGHVTG